jgi:hypothetical protein
MRESATFIALIGAALVPIACGGAPQSSAQNPSPVAIGSDPVMAEGPINLSPVKEPGDVVVVARWKSPRRVFDTVQQWLGLPIPLEMGIEEIFRVRGMASIIDMDAPVEMLVALDPEASERNPQPFIGFSVGLRSLHDARQAMQSDTELRETQEGIYRVELGSEYDRLTCLLSSSLGSSPARLVCGPKDRDINALHPYMTRGLPVASMPDSDLHGEVRFGPVRAKFGHMLPGALEMGSSVLSHEFGTGDRNLDRAITDAMSEVSKELLALSNDLDGLRLDVQIDPTGRTLSGEMALSFKNRSAWLSQRFFDNADKAGAPPPIFWNAPAASSNVFFDRGVDGKNYLVIKRHGANLIDAALARENFTAADRKAVVALFDRLLEGSPVSVSASGQVEPPKPGTRPGTDFDQIRDAVTASLGWQIIGLEERSNRVDAWLQDLTRVYGRGSVQQWLRTQLSLDARSMPRVRYAAKTVAGLPGLKALQITVPATALDKDIKGTPKPFTYSVMVLPDGERTWLAMGAEEALLEKHLKTVKAGGAGTIEGKAGLESLRASRTVAGGYITIAGIAAQASGGFMEALDGRGYQNREMERLLGAFARIPNHGETPILLTSQVQQGSPAQVSVKFQANRGTIDDLRSLLLTMGLGGRP